MSDEMAADAALATLMGLLQTDVRTALADNRLHEDMRGVLAIGAQLAENNLRSLILAMKSIDGGANRAFALERLRELLVGVIGMSAAGISRGFLTEFEAVASAKGSHAANARHAKLGGSREKREQIRAIWASGKYLSRDRCAEEEYAALGVSFATARRHLRGTPNPT